MTDRDLILSALPEPAGGVVSPPFSQTCPVAADLWLEFEERLVALGGQMVPVGALEMLVNRDSGFWADEDALALLPPGGKQATTVWDAEVGVCLAELAIAETGSLLLSASAGRWRMTSLAPPVNVVLVREADIVRTVDEGFQRTPSTTSVIVTGTSRTADIEGVLVRGVHGPRELYVVRI